MYNVKTEFTKDRRWIIDFEHPENKVLKTNKAYIKCPNTLIVIEKAILCAEYELIDKSYITIKKEDLKDLDLIMIDDIRYTDRCFHDGNLYAIKIGNNATVNEYLNAKKMCSRKAYDYGYK